MCRMPARGHCIRRHYETAQTTVKFYGSPTMQVWGPDTQSRAGDLARSGYLHSAVMQYSASLGCIRINVSRRLSPRSAVLGLRLVDHGEVTQTHWREEESVADGSAESHGDRRSSGCSNSSVRCDTNTTES